MHSTGSKLDVSSESCIRISWVLPAMVEDDSTGVADVLILSVLRVMISPPGAVGLALEAGCPGRCPRTVCFWHFGATVAGRDPDGGSQIGSPKKRHEPKPTDFCVSLLLFQAGSDRKIKSFVYYTSKIHLLASFSVEKNKTSIEAGWNYGLAGIFEIKFRMSRWSDFREQWL